MHVLFFISNKKAVQTINHNYIYISLLLAALIQFNLFCIPQIQYKVSNTWIWR